MTLADTSDPFHATHFDAQDDRVVVACFDIGVGPAVVFDGGGFTDAEKLRAVAADLLRGADWLDGGTWKAERDRYREALARLVALKDGPRDDDYERCKPLAWDQARAALSAALPGTEAPAPASSETEK